MPDIAFRQSWCGYCFGMFLGLFVALPLHAQDTFDFTADFVRNGSTVSVTTRAWVPDGVDRVKGLIVAFPGTGGGTITLPTNPTWQQTASLWQFGIVGMQDGDGQYLGLGADEVQSNIQYLLDTVAGLSDHSEISNAPIFVTGFSKGAIDIGSNSVPWISDRVLGFVADKSVGQLSDDMDPGTLFPTAAPTTVPTMTVVGNNDNIITPGLANLGFLDWRSDGAQIAQLVDQGGHGDTSNELKFAFFDQVIKARYPEGQVPSLEPGNPLELETINSQDGWLGESNVLNDSNTLDPLVWPDIAPAEEYAGDAATASWLPNETMAMVFRAHNHRPLGTSRQQLRIDPNVVEDFLGNVLTYVDVRLDPVAHQSIKLYLEDTLLAELGPGTGTERVEFTPTKNGLHTFIAVAEYEFENQTHFVSNYATLRITHLEEVPEPTTIAMAAIAAFALLSVLGLRTGRSTPSVDR